LQHTSRELKIWEDRTETGAHRTGRKNRRGLALLVVVAADAVEDD
jgi:hypothetical protein